MVALLYALGFFLIVSLAGSADLHRAGVKFPPVSIHQSSGLDK